MYLHCRVIVLCLSYLAGLNTQQGAISINLIVKGLNDMTRITINNIKDAYASKLVDVKTMTVKGYELIDELFVDGSGFGSINEPALLPDEFERQLTNIVNEHGTVYTTVTNAGQFQVYVGVFKRTGKATGRKIAGNTLRYTEPDGTDVIRLHATDILRSKDGTTSIYNGGYYTKTTKDRINKYLPDGYYISQKNYEWFLYKRTYHPITDTYTHELVAPFTDGLTIDGVI